MHSACRSPPRLSLCQLPSPPLPIPVTLAHVLGKEREEGGLRGGLTVAVPMFLHWGKGSERKGEDARMCPNSWGVFMCMV